MALFDQLYLEVCLTIYGILSGFFEVVRHRIYQHICAVELKAYMFETGRLSASAYEFTVLAKRF